MRIIAGSLKGRRLKPPTWEGLRPTSDKLRETLFNVLAGRVQDARVVDGFAGTGAIGIEAISRGAKYVSFIEKDARATELIAANLAACGVADGFAVITAPFGKGAAVLRRHPSFEPFDIVLLDPPYQQDARAQNTEGLLKDASALVGENGLVVLEHARKRDTPVAAGPLRRTRVLASGDSALSFYTRLATAD